MAEPASSKQPEVQLRDESPRIIEDDGLSPAQLGDFTRANQALGMILAGSRAATTGRVTQDRPGWSSMGTQMLTIVPPPYAEAAWRALDLDLISLERVSPATITQLLADLSPEVSSGLNDFLRFCNPGFDITAMNVGTETPNARAQDALDLLLDSLKSYYGTVDVVINRLFMSAFMRGAFLAEGVFGPSGKGMIDIATPDPAVVRFQRASDPVRGDIYQLGQWQGGKFVVFDRPTVRYIPVDPFPGVPYGRPMIAPAIFLALFNLGLLRDIRRVVAQQGYPRLDVAIDLDKLFQSLPPGLNTIEQFADWAKRQLEDVAKEYSKVRPEDAYVHFSFAAVNRPIGALDSSSLGAVDGLTKAIERGLARALKTSPIILGLTEGTSEAQANRQWEIHAARIKALQHPCETLLSELFVLHLNSLGIQADVKVEFGELRSAELLRDAQVRQLELANADAAYKAGYITLEQAAKDGYGVDELPDEAERYQPPLPPGPGPGTPEGTPPPNNENPEPGSNRSAHARHNQPGDHPIHTDKNGNEFVPAADLKGALAGIKKLGPAVSASGDVPLHVANNVYQGLFDLKCEKYKMPAKVTFDETLFEGRKEGKDNVPAMCSVEGFEFKVNPSATYWKNPEGISAAAKKQNFWTTDHPRHIVYHEVGHGAHRDWAGKPQFEQLKTTKPPSKFAGEISAYGMTNAREFVAEVFAGHLAGRTFSPEVIKQYNDYAGAKLK